MVDLFRKYLQNNISRTELQELMDYVGQPDNRAEMIALIRSALTDDHISPDQAEQLHQLLDGLDSHVLNRVKAMAEGAERKVWIKRRRVAYLRVAAVLAVALSVGAAFYLYRHETADNTVQIPQLADIQPGGNRAILVVEGGETIVLDSTQLGVKVEPGVIRYEGGALVTQVSEGEAGIQYATLTTSRGGQYQVTLPDGSNVWLNAASSLRYPVRFTGDTREVELEGEGYFEVAANKHQPFIVKSKQQAVEVLGTKFNINVYENEGAPATTLLEGAVRLVQASDRNNRRELQPGQQAVIRDGRIQVKPVNVSYYTSWKDGKFTFDRIGLSVVLRQIERWYDVEFEYDKAIPEVPLWGTLSRNVLLSELLQALEINTGYQFKREGRKVIMSQ
ncbi:hypothetical protein GCM10011386_36440 [Parapedobacter defluvii]|uniref:FecR family protein n=1 Tax=Parapedobacter defluvii TaxID=2045106 RepID=A0ABQ1MIJ1_9SPHI|nr:FecR domain-containing protein [Parapedobacter defluvii]GGC41118.1 hypothetical protein GCM10011386_36440 [Parapedobacter defluvii]